MTILIKNTSIADGSGQPLTHGDVLIRDEKIEKIGHLENEVADTVIDGTGLVTAPGFIDAHSHSDLQILTEPKVMPKIMQGITTEILGQDGISMAPLPEQYISPWRKNLSGLDGESDAINWHYQTTQGYFSEIEKAGPGVNVCYLAPHGNIRMEAMGLQNKKPTAAELQKMCDIMRREMDAGAIGLSSGLIYMPCAYSETEELVEICRVVAERDGTFVVHQRSESNMVLQSMDEILEIGRRSGVRIHFSHLKVCGKDNWGKIETALKKLDEAIADGLRVSFDQYPYVAGSTMLGVILPPWAHDGGTNELLGRLRDHKLREKMIEDIKNNDGSWDNFIGFAGLENIYITNVKTEKNRDAVGKNLVEFGELRKKDPYDAVLNLLLEEENAVSMFDYYGLEEHVQLFMKRAEMCACTDGLLSNGKPHPRVYGTFPRILGKYVREDKCLTLEEAVCKMTNRAAQTFSIKNRGLIKEGYYADIVLFDADKVIDKATFWEPVQYSAGIEYVLVNGKISVEKGRHTEIRNGRVLRGGG